MKSLDLDLNFTETFQFDRLLYSQETMQLEKLYTPFECWSLLLKHKKINQVCFCKTPCPRSNRTAERKLVSHHQSRVSLTPLNFSKRIQMVDFTLQSVCATSRHGEGRHWDSTRHAIWIHMPHDGTRSLDGYQMIMMKTDELSFITICRSLWLVGLPGRWYRWRIGRISTRSGLCRGATGWFDM